jgi:hypothetical protein
MTLVSLAKLHAVASDRKPGYLTAVMAVAVPVSETHIQVPEDDFARIRREYALSVAPKPSRQTTPSGPGTELKALLATIGIVASPTCKCNKMARQMDEWGQESLHHIEEIVDVMEETAKKRKLPFLRTAGRTLVRIACWKAKRKGNGK